MPAVITLKKPASATTAITDKTTGESWEIDNGRIGVSVASADTSGLADHSQTSEIADVANAIQDAQVPTKSHVINDGRMAITADSAITAISAGTSDQSNKVLQPSTGNFLNADEIIGSINSDAPPPDTITTTAVTIQDSATMGNNGLSLNMGDGTTGVNWNLFAGSNNSLVINYNSQGITANQTAIEIATDGIITPNVYLKGENQNVSLTFDNNDYLIKYYDSNGNPIEVANSLYAEALYYYDGITSAGISFDSGRWQIGDAAFSSINMGGTTSLEPNPWGGLRFIGAAFETFFDDGNYNYDGVAIGKTVDITSDGALRWACARDITYVKDVRLFREGEGILAIDGAEASSQLGMLHVNRIQAQEFATIDGAETLVTGATGAFTTNDGQYVTVVNGLITNITNI